MIKLTSLKTPDATEVANETGENVLFTAELTSKSYFEAM